MKKFGIDVSNHQGVIDWSKVQTNFAILRAGYGREISQKDEQFERNYNECKKHNINCGCYWYSYATTVEDTKKEAEVCLEVIKGKQFEYPIYFDIEEERQANLGTEKVSAIIKAFCDILENNGYWVGVYSYKSFLENYLDEHTKNRYAVWVAHTGVEQTTYSSQFGIWQYSHTGKTDGVSGDVDCNYCYLDYPQMIADAGLNNVSKAPEQSYIEYTVKRGDTLWGIAKDLLGDGSQYRKIKELNELVTDVIYPNQVLKIPVKSN